MSFDDPRIRQCFEIAITEACSTQLLDPSYVAGIIESYYDASGQFEVDQIDPDEIQAVIDLFSRTRSDTRTLSERIIAFADSHAHQSVFLNEVASMHKVTK